jgi:large subunit ribosomal protein L15
VKLHELKPARGSRRARTRVGRGIAAGQGKTAGRGTKGQKARAGASIPGWFEGGQTPIHIRVPKLRGFRNPFKIDYQVVNVGRIAEYAAAGRFGVETASPAPAARGRAGSSDAPVTINPENLAAAGLVSSASRPVKVLGHGDVAAKLFVVADAFTGSARTKVEAAGGFVQLLNPPIEKPDAEAPTKRSRKAAAPAAAEKQAPAAAGEPAAAASAADEPATEAASDAAAGEATADEPATESATTAESKPRRKRPAQAAGDEA